jgi:membrane-bound ClpP family serine protease
MAWSVIIPVIVFGLLLVLLEIFILPGLVAGIVGGLLVVFGVYQSYLAYGVMAGSIVLFATIAVFIILMVLFFKSGTWRKVALSDVVEGKMNTIDKTLKAGVTGKTISRLAPMGKALINNDYCEVTTNGEFVDENEEIIIVKIEGNKIIVRKT